MITKYHLLNDNYRLGIKTYMSGNLSLIRFSIGNCHKRVVFFKRSYLLTLIVFPQETIMSTVSYFCVFLLLSSLVARVNCSSGEILKLKMLDNVIL